MRTAEDCSPFMNEIVVVDTGAPVVYIGTLTAVEHGALVLEDVDVHDMADTNTTKEMYILEARKYGVKKNRRSTHVRLDQVVGISKLDDIIEY